MKNKLVKQLTILNQSIDGDGLENSLKEDRIKRHSTDRRMESRTLADPTKNLKTGQALYTSENIIDFAGEDKEESSQDERVPII